ncbi:MAG TPA: MFS transporter [Bradyrhizobium sp.]|nr:MFS transporter [Bradyrhizobium sp.]
MAEERVKRHLAAIFASAGSLILGISLIQLANGYIGTLIGIRLAVAHVDPIVTGIVTSAYFAGYAIGATICHRLIGRAGHIRAFAAFAAIVAAAFLGHALYFSPILWMGLRALVGFGCAGLFIATESWLNAKATAATRGTVFGIYMVATYATFAGGQFTLNLASPTEFTLFALAAILFCLALALVATTRAEQPPPVASSHLRVGELTAAAPVAAIGCFAGGLISGSFYALVPVYAQSIGLSMLEISSYMAIAIAGGMVMQIPIGKLSDSFDRRVVVGLVAFAFAALALAIDPAWNTPWFPAVWLLVGGFMSVIYPVCVAHANDRMPAERAVSVSGRLILLSGIGSAVGPLLGATTMSEFGIRGLFYLMAAAAALFAVFALARGQSVPAPLFKRRRPFLLLPAIFAHDLAHASHDSPTVITRPTSTGSRSDYA